MVVVIALGAVYVAVRGSPVKTYTTVEGIKCQSHERLDYHVHARLAIFVEGNEVPVEGGIGIRDDCLFWLHTHGEDGLIHVEAPERQDYSLGQFFAVWGQPLSERQLLDHSEDASHEVTATVNGEEYSSDPSAIRLEDGVEIVLQYGALFVSPSDEREQ